MGSYGFDDDLPEINLPTPKKKKPKPKQENIQKAAEAGRGLGFIPREPAKQSTHVPRKGGRRPSKEPLDKIFIAGPQRVTDAFRVYCEDEGLSYWEALERLLPTTTPSQ